MIRRDVRIIVVAMDIITDMHVNSFGIDELELGLVTS